MQIGIDARMYGPKQTGIGNYIKYLVEYLARVDTKNKYYIFLSKQEYDRFMIHPPRRTRFTKVLADFDWYSVAEQIFFLKTLSRYSLDLMHFPHFNVPLLYNKPFVVTIHDLTPKFFPGHKVGKSVIRRKAYDVVLKHAVATSKAIITPSRFTKQDILKHFSVSSSKIHVIPEGIPLPRTVRGSVESKPYFLNPIPYILYVGVWRSHKNLEGLIEAYTLLKKQGLKHKLVIVGDPDIYYEKVANAWKARGLQDDIIAPGFQREAELAWWYKHASLLVLPSFYEGFGLTPLVALSFDVPVVVSNIGALKETLGDSAFYFNPSNLEDIARAIKKALTSEKAQKEKLAKAKTLLKKYNWQKMAKETLKVFHSITIQ